MRESAEMPLAGLRRWGGGGDGSGSGAVAEKTTQNILLLPCYNRFTFLQFLLCEYAL
jgi:hypothetical protein